MTWARIPAVRLLAAAALALLGLLFLPDVEAQANTPGAPTIDKMTARGGWLLVEWSAPSSDGGSAITAYDVRYIETDATDKADANWTEMHDVWTTGDGVLRYKLDGLTNDTEYDVQVRAVNTNGDGDWSTTTTSTPELSAKTRATIASVRSDDTAIAVTWNAPTETVATITVYDMRYIETDATDKADANWTVKDGAWTRGRRLYGVTGLTNDTEYDVQVRHVDSFGDGPWSDTMSATPKDFADFTDFENSKDDATELTLETESLGRLDPLGSNRFWGKIEAVDDEDFLKLVITETQVPAPEKIGIWIFTDSDLDTVGELLDEDGDIIEEDDYGAVLPNVEDFFMWVSLEAGTYYLKVNGYGSGDTGEYQLVIRTFADTECAPGKLSVVLSLGGGARGMLDTDDDTDCFIIDLTASTDVIFRSSGFPDAVGELYNSGGRRIASNDDGLLIPSIRQFLIRRSLAPGTYFLRVRSWLERSDGPFVVYATEAGDPGNTAADAEEIELGVAAGGNITTGTDVDFFKFTLADPTYVRIWTARNSGNVDTDGELLDSGSVAVADLDFAGDFSGRVGFGIEHRLEAGTYYIKVTGDRGTGQYTIRVTEDVLYQRFVNSCSDTTDVSAGINDVYYRCQWHLRNHEQLEGTSGEDIDVEGVWSDGNMGQGINVVVVDDGMHHQHEDLHENVETSRNQDYRPGSNDIHTPGRTHGTAVAGLIAARDNDMGMRGVAPRATIYGYNYLVEQSNANEADAMSRNAATTAISNNSWGPGDFAGPETASSMWQAAVEDGVTNGYGGKGVLYVWSGGNGAREGDNSNLDEYNNLYAVTSVCAVDHHGKRASYSEPGSNLWVCAPSSDREDKAAGIATTDNGHRYQDGFGGTSAAAPIVSGVAALIRAANNDLTWRDVKLILAASARKNDTTNTDWETGESKYGATGSYEFNHEYGFGVVDAAEAVDLASGWRNLPPLRETTVASASGFSLSIPDATADMDGNTEAPGSEVSAELDLETLVEFIEYIHVDTNFSHDSFRDLDIELESPSGKVSKLVPHFEQTHFAPFVPLIKLNSAFRFGSAKHLGEDPNGTWTLKITDHHTDDTGTLGSWKITAYGHRVRPMAPDVEDVIPASGGFTAIWKAPSDTGQSDITRYDVRYILSSATDADKGDDTKWTTQNAGNPGALQYTESGLDSTKQYDVQVRAVNDGGDGPWSATSTVTPLTDEAPTIETITPGNGTLTAAWTAPTNTALGTVTSYDLRYGRGSAPSSWTTVDDAWTSGTLEYVVEPDPLLTNGVTYGVQVRAVVGTDDKPWSSTRTGTPRTVPGAPSIYQADPGESGELIIEWNPPGDNGGAAVTSYDVRYIKTSEDETVDSNWTEQIGGGLPGEEKYVATGLDNWVKYDVQVRAENPAGAGEWSTTETGTPTNSNVRVMLEWEDTSVDVDEDDGSVTLTAIATTDRDEALPSDFFFQATVETAAGVSSGATELTDYVPSPGMTLTFRKSNFDRMEVSGQQRYRATQTFSVAITNDTMDETDETFTATLAYVDPTIANLQPKGAIPAATVTIKDDEHVPVELGWLDDTVSVNEGSSTVTLNATATTTVDKRPESGFSFQAEVSTSDGTGTDRAVAPNDFTDLITSVTFERRDFSSTTVGGDQRWRATKSVLVPIINDTSDERDETFTATVDYVDSAPLHLTGGSADATVTIVDNDLPPVSIEAVTSTATEGETLTFQLTRDGVTDDELTVNVRVTENGRMLAASPPTAATFGAGLGTTTLDVVLTEDTEDEDNSVVTVVVRSGTDYTVGSPSSAQATAMDDDHVPVTLSWDRTVITVAERASEVTLRAAATTTKDKPPEGGFSFGVEVAYADGTADSGDYSAGSTSEIFRQSDFNRTLVSGQHRYRAVKEFTVNIASADGDEADETFTATLDYADDSLPYLRPISNRMLTVTITDDDDPLVTISYDGTSVTEADSSVTFTLDRDGQATSALRVNVDVTESGGNMLARAGRYTVNFAAGSDEATLEVSLRDDTEDEENSAVTAEVVSGLGYFPGSDSAASTIVTDDDHVSVELEWEETQLTVDEGEGTVALTAVATTTKDKAPESGFDFNATVTVADGSAMEDEDFLPPSDATLTFDEGDFDLATVDGQSRYQATETFVITIEPDNGDEPDENFTAHLAWETPGEPHLRGGSSRATVTITDDDPVPLVLGWERPEWAVEEPDGSVTLKAVAITAINRIPEDGFSFDAAVSTSNGSASQGNDYSRLSATETFLRSDFSRVTFDGQSRYRAEKEFTIAIEADNIDESNEDFRVQLRFDGSTHANLTTGVDEATVWIIEDDTDTADVQLTRNSSPGSVSQGATLTYEYTVRNDGPATATDLLLVIHLDPHVSVDTADLPSECRRSGEATGGVVDCSLGNLGDGGNEDIRVEVTVESVPSDGIINRAHVTGSQADPTPGNNTYPAATGGGTTPPRPPPITGGGGGGGGGGPVNRAPVFVDAEGDAIAETSRAIAEDAAPGANIGEPVAATDPEEDTLTYTLGGEDAASFAIDASTGQLTTATALDHETQASYTVTVIATDPSGATAEVRVTITVVVTEVEYDCSTGNAVADAADNPGLVADCEALLKSRDIVSGDATLNWSEDTPIAEWDGVRLHGTPQRVTRLYLAQKSLGGTIPADLGSLSALTGLYLHRNELTGPIPSQLGELSSLVHLTLHRNRLSGEVPAALG